MNLQHKVELARRNERCGHCLNRKVAKICRTCMIQNQLAGFCTTCMFKHNLERAHQANFKNKMRETTIRKILWNS